MLRRRRRRARVDHVDKIHWVNTSHGDSHRTLYNARCRYGFAIEMDGRIGGIQYAHCVLRMYICIYIFYSYCAAVFFGCSAGPRRPSTCINSDVFFFFKTTQPTPHPLMSMQYFEYFSANLVFQIFAFWIYKRRMNFAWSWHWRNQQWFWNENAKMLPFWNSSFSNSNFLICIRVTNIRRKGI